MKSMLQVLRQPLKSLAGLILAALSLAILITCVGQYTAAQVTRASLNDRYDTVALVSNEYLTEQIPEGMRIYMQLPEKIQSWVTDTVQSRPDLVKEESYSRLFSAYAPACAVDNFSRHKDSMPMGHCDRGYPYRCAMLVVTLDKIGTVLDEDTSEFTNAAGETKIVRNYISILCRATVDRVIGLEPGFASPEGKTINLTITVYEESELASLGLKVGEKYMVYGMDYSHVRENFPLLVKGDWEAYLELYGPAKDAMEITEQIACYMTVYDYSALPLNYMDNGEIITLRDQRKYYDRDEDAVVHMQFMPAQEYIEKYRVPTMEKLTGTAEEFLAREENALWRKALEELEINNHAFPILAVDKLGYQAAFARGQARIVAGRDFTEGERTDGSRVCILAESLAAASGLKVGDTIDLRPYALDFNNPLQLTELMSSTAFPSAAFYSGVMGFTAEAQPYTIVGLYRQNNAWQNQYDAYGFTPNVIFVPKPSITGDMRTGKAGIYYTLVLQNGKMAEFQKLQAEAGYPDLFICMDQGYTEIASGLDAYQSVSGKALYLGVAAYAVLIALFFILFPLQHTGALATMSTLGATRGGKVGHIAVSSMCILIPGGILGGVTGALLWKWAAAKLMETANVQIPLEANMTLLASGLTAAHILLTSVCVLLLAIPLTANRGLMKRK